MTIFRIIAAAFFRIIAAAFALSMGMASVSGAAAAPLQCKHSASEYLQVIKRFESEAARARMLADRNPLYESDVAYYAAALVDARACHRSVGPAVTASR